MNLNEIDASRWPHWRSDDGNVLLINADCLEVLPVLPKVDAVVTDPPYGINFAAQPTKWQRLAGQKPESWDDKTLTVVNALPELAQYCVVWGGNYSSLPPSRGWLSWFKPDSPPSMASLELAWTSRDMNARQISHSISATNAERCGHPTQKPLRVMEWCLEFVDSESVLDPFMGSGTTGVACVRLGRKFIGIELEPKYYEIAIKRIRDEQGRFPLFDAKETQRDLFETTE